MIEFAWYLLPFYFKVKLIERTMAKRGQKKNQKIEICKKRSMKNVRMTNVTKDLKRN